MSSIRRGSLFLAAALAVAYAPLSQAVHLVGLPGGTALPGAVSTQGGSFLPHSCEGTGGLTCDQTMQPAEAALCVDADGDKVCDSRDECPNTPAGEPVFLNGCQPSAETIYVLRGVNFETDKSRITNDSRQILDDGVATLKKVPDLLVSIDGHTDERASDAYNKALSFRRAQAVYRYFVNAGISADRLVFRGFGEEVPLDPASNETAWAKNRRVELAVLAQWEFDAIKAELGSAADVPMEVEEDFSSSPAASFNDDADFPADDSATFESDEGTATVVEQPAPGAVESEEDEIEAGTTGASAQEDEDDFSFEDDMDDSSAPAEEENFDALFGDDAGTGGDEEDASSSAAAAAAEEEEEEEPAAEPAAAEPEEQAAEEEPAQEDPEPAAEEEPAEEEAPSEPSEPMNVEDDDFFSDEDFGSDGGSDDEFNFDDLGI